MSVSPSLIYDYHGAIAGGPQRRGNLKINLQFAGGIGVDGEGVVRLRHLTITLDADVIDTGGDPAQIKGGPQRTAVDPPDLAGGKERGTISGKQADLAVDREFGAFQRHRDLPLIAALHRRDVWGWRIPARWLPG